MSVVETSERPNLTSDAPVYSQANPKSVPVKQFDLSGFSGRRSALEAIVVASIGNALPLLGRLRGRQLQQVAVNLLEKLQESDQEIDSRAAAQLQDDIGRLKFFRSVSQNVKKA